jgi:hypothetical protein
MQTSGVAHFPHHDDTFAAARVMSIMDQNIDPLFLGSMSWDRPELESRGSPARLDIRRAATTTRCSTSESPDCSPIWRWRTAMAVTPGY